MEKIKKYGKIAIAVIAVLILIGLAIVIAILYGWFGVLLPFYNVPNENKYVTEYDPSMGLVSEETLEALEAMDTDKVSLGINEAGNVVFQHPYKAFGKTKKAYKVVWKYGDKELDMKHLSRTFYIEYSTDEYVAKFIDANQDYAKDAIAYQEILQIYANSYNKHR